jgi:hypothetical protein
MSEGGHRDYFMIPNALVDGGLLRLLHSLLALKIYLHLRRIANPGTTAEIGLNLLAHECGCSKQGILNGREELRKSGLLDWTEGGGRKNRTVYRLLPIRSLSDENCHAGETVSNPETVTPTRQFHVRRPSGQHPETVKPARGNCQPGDLETVKPVKKKGKAGLTTTKNYRPRTTDQELPTNNQGAAGAAGVGGAEDGADRLRREELTERMDAHDIRARKVRAEFLATPWLTAAVLDELAGRAGKGGGVLVELIRAEGKDVAEAIADGYAGLHPNDVTMLRQSERRIRSHRAGEFTEPPRRLPRLGMPRPLKILNGPDASGGEA